VLSFPAKPGDGAVVAVCVELAGDAERGPWRGCVVQVCLQKLVLDILHQTEAEDRRRNAENGVVVGDRGNEAGLLKVATRSVHATGDGEDVMHAAIQRAVRIPDKANLANWPVAS